MIDLIIPPFSAIYGPRQELSFDEMTISLEGISTLRVDNPKQPNMAIKHLLLSQSLSHSEDFLSYSMDTSITTFKSQSFKILISKLNIFFKK